MISLKWLALVTLVGWYPVALGDNNGKSSGSRGESLREGLHIQPLSSKYTALTFRFVTNSLHPHQSSEGEPHVKHYSLLRRSLSKLVDYFDILELRLSFTRGNWDYERFGDPLDHSPAQSGAGVEVAAWLHDLPKDTTATDPSPRPSLESKWQDLIHSLSGMFCATLAAASQPTLFSSPRLSFPPKLNLTASGDSAFPSIQLNQSLFHAHLPQESACTENLTPWIKQLPCRHHAGLASLLKPHVIFNSYYSSIALDIYPVCNKESCKFISDYDLVTSQSLTIVLDPLQLSERSDWKLSTLFKSQIEQPCPLAQQSEVVVHSDHPTTKMSANQKMCRTASLTLSPSPPDGWTCDGRAVYPLTKGDPFDLVVAPHSTDLTELVARPQLIEVERHIVDRIGLQGGLMITLSNLADTELTVSLFQSLPWFLQPYLHTLRMSINDEPFVSSGTAAFSAIHQIFFQPARDKQKASALELFLTLPPTTTVRLHIEFVAKFLSLDQYPPDPNRGFSVGPAIVTLLPTPPTVTDPRLPLDTTHFGKRYYTSNLLVFLPTPDFSMPYNVATFTSTLFALYFGSVFNSLTRQFALTKAP